MLGKGWLADAARRHAPHQRSEDCGPPPISCRFVEPAEFGIAFALRYRDII